MAREYVVHDVARCNMCAAPVSEAKVLGRRLSTSQGPRPTRRVGLSTTIMRCSRCGLVFANPLPVPRDIGAHYDVDPGDYWSPTYFRDDPGYFRPQAARFRELWGGARRPVALDVGAGIGKSMRSLSAEGFDVYGCEPSAAFRQAAVERAGIDEERLKLGAVEYVDYEPGSFDFVTFGRCSSTSPILRRRSSARSAGWRRAASCMPRSRPRTGSPRGWSTSPIGCRGWTT